MLTESSIYINPSAQVSLQLSGQNKADVAGLERYKNVVRTI